MAERNLGSRQLSEEKFNEALQSITTVKESLKDVLVSITPEERKRYGSVNEQNKLFVNKVNDYYKSDPSLASPDVNWNEFKEDYATRERLDSLIRTLEDLVLGLYSSKILHDYDNYQAALADYSYTNYKQSMSALGYEKKANELKQFFKKEKNKEE